MDAHYKELWLKELRSGKREQGQQYLNKNDEKFCCLGVLCEIGVAEGDLTRTKDEDTGVVAYNDRPSISGYYSGLPHAFAVKLNIDDMGERDSGVALYLLNDTGTSFGEIADIIEAEF